nr:hypothetical protein [Pyxidicoccus fallax]
MDVTVVVAPSLRSAFEGRREVNLGLPSGSGLGDVLESLFMLYPQAWRHMATERGGGADLYLQLAMDERAAEALSGGGGGLSGPLRLYVFSLSRVSRTRQAGVEG